MGQRGGHRVGWHQSRGSPTGHCLTGHCLTWHFPTRSSPTHHGPAHASPRRHHVEIANAQQGPADGIGQPGSGVGYPTIDVVIGAHNHIGGEASHQRLGQPDRQRGHDVDPMRRQPGAQHRHRDDHPTGQPGHLGVNLHHLLVGEYVGSADVEHPAGGVGHVEHRHQIKQHVTDGDGLAPGAVHPLGHHHHRQHLHQAAQHLETGTARPDDDGGAQLGHRHRPGGQNLAHLVATGQMRRQAFGRPKTPEVDDATHPGSRCGITNVGRTAAVGVGKVGSIAHGVHQVVHRVSTGERCLQRRHVEHVTAHHLHGIEPRQARQIARGAGHAHHLMAGSQKLAHQPTTHVARGTNHHGAQRRAAGDRGVGHVSPNSATAGASSRRRGAPVRGLISTRMARQWASPSSQ